MQRERKAWVYTVQFCLNLCESIFSWPYYKRAGEAVVKNYVLVPVFVMTYYDG